MRMHSLCTQIYETHTHSQHHTLHSTSHMVVTEVWLVWSAANDYHYYVYDNVHGATMEYGKKNYALLTNESLVSLLLLLLVFRALRSWWGFLFLRRHRRAQRKLANSHAYASFALWLKCCSRQLDSIPHTHTHLGALECTWHRFGARPLLSAHRSQYIQLSTMQVHFSNFQHLNANISARSIRNA